MKGRVTNNFYRKILLMNNNFNIQSKSQIPKPEILKLRISITRISQNCYVNMKLTGGN